MDWTMGEDRYMAEYRGESRDDRDPLAPDHGQYPTCDVCETAIAECQVEGRLLCPACADPKESEMDPSLEQAMRALAGNLRRFLDDDVDFIERRLNAIDGFLKQITERLDKTRVLAEEMGRLTEKVEGR